MIRLNLIPSDERKPCAKCGRITSRDDRGPGRNRNQCKDCIAAYQHAHYVSQQAERSVYAKAYYQANREAVKASTARRNARIGPERRSAYSRVWRLDNSEQRMLDAARKRAAARGLAFDITLEDIVIPHVCPVLGIAIDRSALGKPCAGSPSIDRIDNSRGYVRGNVAVISMRANQIKRDATADELERIAVWMRANGKTEN